MSARSLEQAKRNAILARRRLDSSLMAVQQRLRPGNLAGEAWDGVKDKSADLADGALQAVKRRPAAVSIAVGAIALFLARDPIRKAVTRLVSGEVEEDGRVVTRIETDDSRLSVSSPIVDTPVTEGVK